MRLIDADVLFTKQKSHADLFKGSDKHDDIIRRDEATMALAEIQNAPTIEAEPVRRGRWITIFPDTAKCLSCGWWQRTTMYNLPDDIAAFSECYRFCTSCGARMGEAILRR